MSVTIETVTIADGAATTLALGPLPAPAHVLVISDNDVWMATSAGIEVRQGIPGVALLAADVLNPIPLNLATGDELFFGSALGNGPVDLTFIITAT
jgi:hypothetical protein